MDYRQIVSNVEVLGFDSAVRASKYPMAVDVGSVSSDITDRAISLGQAPAGSAHDNWLHGIVVKFDLTFTVKAWTEAERYHFFEIVSSQSTMHRIAKIITDTSDCYIDYVDPRAISLMKELVDKYNEDPSEENYLRILYTNPTGLKLTAGMVTNYCQLKTIYRQRKNHKLPEWKAFCRWIETLPHSYLITGKAA